VLEHPLYRACDTRAPVRLAFVVARIIGVFGAPAGALFDAALFGRAQRNARAPRLGEADRTPCSPRRILRISSCTNSPAWVLGAFPARLSFCAFSTMRFSGRAVPPAVRDRSRDRSRALPESRRSVARVPRPKVAHGINARANK
jgi:hypothetical protein